MKEAAPTLDSQLVTSLMRNFTALSPHLIDSNSFGKVNGEGRLRLQVESIFVFSLVWSIGCSCATNHLRIHFDAFIRAAVSESLHEYVSPSGEQYVLPEDIPTGHVSLSSPSSIMPKEGLVYDYAFDDKGDKWKLWSSMINITPFPADSKFRKIIVPTADTVRYTFVLDKTIKAGTPILIVGPTGTGKSVMVQNYLFSLPPEDYVAPNIIGFSARTTVNTTQHLIDAKLDRRRKGVFGPPTGKKAVVFVDDLNMPQLGEKLSHA